MLRHGQTEYNRVGRFQGDPDLDPVGYINRTSLWMLLREQPINAIYTSEMQRTQRTAALVSRQHGVPIQVRPALNEINSGVLEGVCYGQIDPQARRDAARCAVPARGSRPQVTLVALREAVRHAAKLRAEDRIPLGESHYDVAVRTGAFVEELRGGARDREVLVVGHGVINRVLLHHLMGWSVEAVAHLRQENDQVYRLETPEAGGPARLSLYTPGVGWRECRVPPQPGAKQLDCNPGAPPKEKEPAPSSQPAAAPSSRPTVP